MSTFQWTILCILLLHVCGCGEKRFAWTTEGVVESCNYFKEEGQSTVHYWTPDGTVTYPPRSRNVVEHLAFFNCGEPARLVGYQLFIGHRAVENPDEPRDESGLVTSSGNLLFSNFRLISWENPHGNVIILDAHHQLNQATAIDTFGEIEFTIDVDTPDTDFLAAVGIMFDIAPLHGPIDQIFPFTAVPKLSSINDDYLIDGVPATKEFRIAQD